MPGVVYSSELIKFPWYRHVPISDISKDSGHGLQAGRESSSPAIALPLKVRGENVSTSPSGRG